mgnify:FL=1
MKKYNANKLRYFPWRWGDRRDGWRVRNVDPFLAMVPLFLRKRLDAQNYFQERVPIDDIEVFVKEHKEEIPGLSIMHVIIAAIVRVFSQRPILNRFVMWNKIFARKYINMSLVVKRSLTDEGEETLIKVYFQPTDTLHDVVKKIQQELDESQHEGQQNSADIISKYLNIFPTFLMRIFVYVLIWMDRFGIFPRVLEEISPWHTSFFLTNIGSIGVESIYHHLYEFGTCSMFVAMGKKSTRHRSNNSGEIVPYKSIQLKFSIDERITDGFYYASSLRMLNRIFQNPEQLLTSPEQIVVDDGVGRKRKDQF